MRNFSTRVLTPAWWPVLVGTLLIALVLSTPDTRLMALTDDDEESDVLGPPVLYAQIRDAPLVPAGRIRNGRLRVDRFDFELTDGDLYLLSPVDERLTGAVYLGRGLVRCYPPDGVEYQQLKKLLGDDYLEEEFDRFVFWFTGDIGERLRAMTDDEPGLDIEKATDLLEDRRKELLENQLINVDSRVLLDLLQSDKPSSSGNTSPYFYSDIDGKDHDWFSIEIEPRELEEIRLSRYDNRRKLRNVWMGFHTLRDFDGAATERAFAGFPRDPEGELKSGDENDNGWDFHDFGLSPRPLQPDHERWSPRLSVPRADVDLSLEGNGDATASVALLIDPLEPLSALRLRISPLLEVTDVRWREEVPTDAEDVSEVLLLPPVDPSSAIDMEENGRGPADPVPLVGEPLHYLQEVHERRMNDDRWEPWLTIELPRWIEPGERFVLEIAYKGKLVERLRVSQDFLLKDTLYWIPQHPDNRRSRFHLTFRIPERYRVASGGILLDERVDNDTRIMQWVTDRQVRASMAFQYGRFEVDEVNVDGMPPVAVYANRNHLGFTPGTRNKTIEDLTVSVRTFSDYFGPYPFDSLLVTETPSYSGQAFPGLVLLTFRAFGALHTGESELFRTHEVAHQWWGAGVDWKSYRDQWISEGFAQYSAALFTLVGMDSEEQFLAMLEAWRLDVLGEVNIGQGLGLRHYGFMPAVIRRSDGNKSGPVVAGYRLATNDTPMDYRLLVYEKGAFILHMIRMMLTDLETGDDERFRVLMRRFVRDHLDSPASTRSFETAVTAAFDEPMDWFFDQWVYGVEIPTYRLDLTVSSLVDAASPFVLHGTIQQEDVRDGFRMPVPIHLQFRDYPPQMHRIWVDAKEVEVKIPLPAEPTKIEFNYHHAVLARVK